MNPAQATNWSPGLAMLTIGIVGALFYLFGNRRLMSEAPAPETLDDIEARYRALLAELRTHIANKHLLPEAEFNAEKVRLEAEAADLLRRKSGKKSEKVRQEARAEKKAAAAAASPTAAQKNPMLVGALVGGAIVAFFAFLGWQVTSTATERGEGMQATGMTPPGMGGPMQQPQQPSSDSKIEALAAKVQANPDDTDAVANLAMYLIRRQAFQDARPLVDRAMSLDPFHPKARVGRAVNRALDGDLRGSIDELEKLSKRYPEAYDGLMFAGMLALEDNDPARAVANLESYIALAPANEQPPMMRMMVVQLKQQMANEPQGQ